MTNGKLLTDLVEETWDIALVESLYRDRCFATAQEFLARLQTAAGVSGEIFAIGSARAGLETLLRTAKARRPDRKRVMIGSFNCKVVYTAAARCGLLVDTFDLDDVRGRIGWEAVGAALTPQHLALVVPHLFGVPSDFRPALPAARRLGCFVIEDCAHTLAGRIGNSAAGDLGDACLFSFNYDKPISLAGGGAFVVRHPELRPNQSSASAASAEAEYQHIRRMMAFLNFVRAKKRSPKIISQIGNRLGLSPYVPPPIPSNLGPLRASLGLWQLERWQKTMSARNANAEILVAAARKINWHIDPDVKPSFLKLRLLVGHEQFRCATIYGRQLGIMVLNSNWSRIVDGENVVNRPNAAAAAANGLEIPVHQNLDVDQRSRLVELVASLRHSSRFN